MNVFDSRYEILERLGEGGMAAVELALDRELDRLVALKRLHPFRAYDDFDVATFRNEAAVLRSLDGMRGVPRLYASGQFEGLPYFVMEFVNGVDLADRVASRRLDWTDSADLLARAALRLDAVHRAGIVHRDVKPANFLVDEDDEVWLIDFGIATGWNSPAEAIEEEFILGTPSFIAPERVDPVPDPRDPRSDVYSLGVMLYEFLSGRLPFDGGSSTQILSRVERLDPPPPHEIARELPRSISEVALKAMAKRPRERYETARAFAAAVFEVLIPIAAERFLRAVAADAKIAAA